MGRAHRDNVCATMAQTQHRQNTHMHNATTFPSVHYRCSPHARFRRSHRSTTDVPVTCFPLTFPSVHYRRISLARSSPLLRVRDMFSALRSVCMSEEAIMVNNNQTIT
eukprot:3422656-Amphidinium_carterae.1